MNIHLHQINQIRAAAQKFRIAIRRDFMDRIISSGGPFVDEWVHSSNSFDYADQIRDSGPIVSSIAAKMPLYAPHRQMLPLIQSRTFIPGGQPSFSRLTPDMI